MKQMKTKTLTPSIMIDGQSVAPKGWIWILGFALGGCEWAIKQASTEAFKDIIRNDLKHNYDKKIKQQIARYQSLIDGLREELNFKEV